VSAAPLAVLARALDPQVDTPEDTVSARILDAALALSAASGLRNLTMDAVARRARVGRMTVYRRFGDRDGLVEALTVRETRRCFAALDRAADPARPIADQVAAGFVTSLRLAVEHPLLARLARVEGETVLETLDGGLFDAAVAFVAQRLRRTVPAAEVDAAAELLVRIACSFVLLPASRLPLDDDERLRAVARTHLVPLLGASG
jgi:AcrR family transcriptional regulator